MRKCSRNQPFAPLQLPASTFEEIEPIERNGRVLKRFRLKFMGSASPILTEAPCVPFIRSDIEVKPLEMPEAAFLLLNTL